MKVQISINDDLLQRVDAYAESTYLSRSGMIAMACTQFLAQHEAMQAVKDIAFSIRKIAESGKIDEDTEKQLKEFEIFVKMITGQK